MTKLRTRSGLALVVLALLTSALPLAAAAQRGGTPLWIDRISASHAPGRKLADPLRLTVDVHVTSRSGAVSGAAVSIVVIGPAGERIPVRATTGRDGFAHITALVPGGGPYDVFVMDVHAGGYFYDPTLDTHTFPGYFIPPVGAIHVAAALLDYHGTRQIRQFTSAGAIVRVWELPDPESPLFYVGPFNVVTDSAGYVYTHLVLIDINTAMLVSCEILKYTSYGALVNVFGTCGNNLGEFASLHDLAVDSNDNLHVLDDDYLGEFNKASVEIFDSGGNHLVTRTVPFNPTDAFMAFDQNDNLYITDIASGQVHKIGPTGNHLLAWSSPQPWKIAVDSSNRISVTDADGDRIRVFTTTGQAVLSWQGGAGGEIAKSIGIDGADRVYLADSDSNAPTPYVGKYTLGGDLLTSWNAGDAWVIQDITAYQ